MPAVRHCFGEASKLTRHVCTVHEKSRDHACPQCDTAFGHATHLRTHVCVVHEQHRDHACPQCDAVFGVALSRHVRVVHDVRKNALEAQEGAARAAEEASRAVQGGAPRAAQKKEAPALARPLSSSCPRAPPPLP